MVIVTDTKSGLLTAFSAKNGGPIVSGNNVEEVTTKYNEAYILFNAVSKLINFTKNVKF
jgi:hypothetical protein